MWDTPVPIFEDEDEGQLVNEFVRLSALYEDKGYEPYQIAQVVFEGLRDPIMRANQAAMVWSKDLAILERIRQAKLVGPADKEIIQSKEEWERRMLAVIEDSKLTSQEKKARIDGLNSIAKARNWVDGEDDGKKGHSGGVVLNFIRDPRSDEIPNAA